jgi:c-di-GMP-binding flagellar brake protein YcgR
MGSSENRRIYPRVNVRISVQGKELKPSSSIFIDTRSRNLSIGGIRFSMDKFVSLACRMVLELDLPIVSEPVKAISKVAWIRKMPKSDFYDIGNQFLEISKKDKEIIDEFINSKIEKKSSVLS